MLEAILDHSLVWSGIAEIQNHTWNCILQDKHFMGEAWLVQRDVPGRRWLFSSWGVYGSAL